MENIQKTPKKGNYTGSQHWIIRFRASSDLRERIQRVAKEEELCVAALVRKLVVDALLKFPV
jgi:hypothetical protein